MTSLTSLIERIEAATEGSRELDVAVILALHPEAGPYQPYCQGDEPIFWNDPYRKMRCPKVSTSIDAALTLLPEGMDWRLERNTDIRMGFGAAVFEPGTPGKYPGIRLYSGTTPALALLAAILRARQTEAQG